MYSPKHLQYLVSVATYQSFSKAADACNVTQSTLSLGIKELERQMGLQLFERSRKNIIATPAGKQAIIHARMILDQQQKMENDIESLANPNAGPLRLGAIPTIAPYFLPEFLPQMDEKFPNSTIHIAEDTTEVILNKIRQGNMDLGLLAFPIGVDDLEHKILFEEDFIVATHRSSPIKTMNNVEDLNHHDLLLLREGHCLKDHILSACKLPKARQNQFFEADSLQTLLAMVNQGYGITLLPEMAVKANIMASYPNINLIRFQGNTPKRQVGLAWRRTDLRNKSYISI